MNKTILLPDKDPMGCAIKDFYYHKRADILRVFSPEFEEDEMPVDFLFRSFEEMPTVEQEALKLAKGRVLDVGAGSGCHALALQQMGKTVEAIDVSGFAVEVMRDQGISARAINFFDTTFQEKYDTLLMLMNGSGIIERLENLPHFFQRVRQLLAPGGNVLMDSSDLSYLYEQEDGSLLFSSDDNHYFGEVEFSLQYGKVKGNPYTWLYLDFDTLEGAATYYKFKVEKLIEGDYYNFLVRLTPIEE